MRLYVDDEREAPEGWTRVDSFAEVVWHICRFDVQAISLDHDLGKPYNGYDIVKMIEHLTAEIPEFEPPVLYCHSDNADGRKYIELAIDNIQRLVRNRRE